MLRFITDFLAYNDTSTTNDPQDSIKIKQGTEESAFSNLIRQQLTIADSVTDQTINLTSSSDYLLIYADQEITIKLNGSVSAITLTPSTAGTKDLVYFVKGTISALIISNASGSAVNLDIISVNI